MKKLLKVIGVILGVFVVLLILLFSLVAYSRLSAIKLANSMATPFKYDKGGAESPEEAYKGFRDALLAGKSKRALMFLYPPLRKEFELAIKLDPVGFGEDLYEWEKLKKGDDPTFLYYWFNTYSATQTIKIGEEEVVVPAGGIAHRIYFQKSSNGKWYIKRL